MGSVKTAYVEFLVNQIPDQDWHPEGSRLDRFLDEEDRLWWQQEEAKYRASIARQVDYDAELQLLQDAIEDEDYWRSGCW